MPEIRPKIKLSLSLTDKIIELISAGLLSALLIYTFVSWFSLPETIPIHFDAKGQPDGYGARISIFFSPILAVGLYIVLNLLNQRPHIFNYPVKITPDNAEYQYRLATRMMRLLNLALVLMFGAITWGTVHSAKSGNSDVILWVLPFALIITFVPIVYYFSKVFKKGHVKPGTAQRIGKHRKYKLY